MSQQVNVTAFSPSGYCFLNLLAHSGPCCLWLPWWPQFPTCRVGLPLCLLRPFLTDAFSYSSSSFIVSSHLLPHTLRAFLLALSPADLPLFRSYCPLPSALKPSPCCWSRSCSLRLTCSRGSHLSCCWKAPSLRPAFRNVQESSAKSTRQGKLFMPFGNLIIWAGRDRLPGKEFSRTSSQGEERENISLTYINGFLTCQGPCPSPVIRLKAEALLPVTEAHPV